MMGNGAPDSAPPLRAAMLALIVVCLALGVVSAAETHHISVAHGAPLSWSTVLASMMPRWLLLAAMLPFALHLASTPTLWSRRTVVFIHVTLFLALSWAHAIVMAWTLAYANPVALLFSWPARLMRAWYGAMPTVVSLYAAVLAVAWALHEARERERRSVRASQLEAQLQTAQLAALRARLQPHFLYNTLNGIAALVVDAESKQAVAAIEQLSELLRASLRDDGRDTVSVREEIALAERYLALQQMRFGHRISHDVSLSPEVADCTVPVLLLQPLVENAVVHGLASGEGTLHVAITARPLEQRIELRVENNGAGLDASQRIDGVGLTATRARLLTAYGDQASLRLLPRHGGGVVVQLVLPGSAPIEATT